MTSLCNTHKKQFLRHKRHLPLHKVKKVFAKAKNLVSATTEVAVLIGAVAQTMVAVVLTVVVVETMTVVALVVATIAVALAVAMMVVAPVVATIAVALAVAISSKTDNLSPAERIGVKALLSFVAHNCSFVTTEFCSASGWISITIAYNDPRTQKTQIADTCQQIVQSIELVSCYLSAKVSHLLVTWGSHCPKLSPNECHWVTIQDRIQ